MRPVVVKVDRNCQLGLIKAHQVNIILTNEITNGIVLCFFVKASNVKAYHCELLELLHCSVISPVFVLPLVHCSVICGTWHVRLLRSTPLLRWHTHNLSHCCIFLACCCVSTAHLVDSTCFLLLLHLLWYHPFLLLAFSFLLGTWLIHITIVITIVKDVHINGGRVNISIQRGDYRFWVLVHSRLNVHITGELLIVAISHWHKGVFGWYGEFSATFPHFMCTLDRCTVDMYTGAMCTGAMCTGIMVTWHSINCSRCNGSMIGVH
jgi:hypothetical protein